MTILNRMSRYHLAREALRRVRRVYSTAEGLMPELDALISKAVAYTRENLHDPPEIRDWTWERG
jgi:xylulose-5-phosphate/fructose-6-phosphate phosphoketolase